MSTGGSAIRGSRVGSGPMGEQDRGVHADRIQIHYWCANGHSSSPFFLASVAPEDIPDTIDCPNCGIPAGRDKDAPPEIGRQEPYKTHLAYVKERRNPEEAEALLQEALDNLRSRRARALAELRESQGSAR
ncbi:MAG TPA: RNA polymerase-binding protein RbpA [Pseudoclavibacter sp.]|nr:RNA polymerase-binding protein RbpA [Pseudoclavibacter sp.]